MLTLAGEWRGSARGRRLRPPPLVVLSMMGSAWESAARATCQPAHGGYVYSKPTGSAHLLGLEHTWRAPTRVDGPLTTAEQPGSCRAPRRDENVAAASGAGRAAGRESPRPDSRPGARSRRNDWHARESHRSVRDPQSCSPSNVAWAASAGRRSAR